MIASIMRLRIFKVIWLDGKSHKKESNRICSSKLHNIVQSIEFYWLNSSFKPDPSARLYRDAFCAIFRARESEEK